MEVDQIAQQCSAAARSNIPIEMRSS